MNALTYLNGSLHFFVDRGAFSGRETRQQLDFTARYFLVARPGVIARGLLAMFRYDATDVLHRINVPTLIVAGDRDVSTKASASLEMAKRIPDARLVMLHPARHMGHFEHHTRFTDEVDRFVASCRAEAMR
jgi:pimeloyl-ACP methyl ester carboxylesterase